eukprot:CAMPEP_0173172768 /NCGR_PEP_ID=MMETSP1141-20130122/2483_1 /TAXON_ID=483371 /ORGANISM="non described non described, Strain CCMP2298" /LENGTH=574 /DNA_ID=CAMNT_0014094823 /DNA_START=61 /DNA_END=1785 /DNA_ORIENTATION=+
MNLRDIARSYCDDEHISLPLASADVQDIQESLLTWYAANRRKLPWRGDSTDIPSSAYGTWISEVMLQQTRVETVIAYWNRWMTTFPTVSSLAAATPDEVNKLWAGLGYYRRCQMLLKGAQKIEADFGGAVPRSLPDLLSIPGIGPYTAGAISSIAFGQPEPLVDGNVMRVFSRLFAVKLELGAGLEKLCWKAAAQLVPAADPASFNQALMELGATLCKPTSPACDVCPVRQVCRARRLAEYAVARDGADSAIALGLTRADAVEIDIEDAHVPLLPRAVTDFPRKVPKKKAREVTLAVCVVRAASHSGPASPQLKRDPEAPGRAGRAAELGVSRYLFVRRPSTGLLANQWEFPSIELAQGAEGTEETLSEDALLAPFPDYFRAKLGIDWFGDSGEGNCALQFVSSQTIERIVHVFSHQRHTMHVHVRDVRVSGGSGGSAGAGYSETRWMTAAEITEVGITTGCKKILIEVTGLGSSSAVKAEAKKPVKEVKPVEESKTESKTKASKPKEVKAPKRPKKSEEFASEVDSDVAIEGIEEIDEDSQAGEGAVKSGKKNAFDVMKRASKAPVKKKQKKS